MEKREITTTFGNGESNIGTKNGLDNVLQMLNEISSSLQLLGSGGIQRRNSTGMGRLSELRFRSS